MILGFPQYLYLALTVIGLAIAFAQDGVKEGRYNIVGWSFTLVLILGLYIWGGAFATFGIAQIVLLCVHVPHTLKQILCHGERKERFNFGLSVLLSGIEVTALVFCGFFGVIV